MSEEPRLRLKDGDAVVSEYWFEQSSGDSVIEDTESGTQYRFGSGGTLDTPAVNTDTSLNGTQIASEYLAKDGTDDASALTSLIEDLDANGGGTALVFGGAITLNSQVAPSTTGNRVVLSFIDTPTIDISGAETSAGASVIDFTSAPNISFDGEVVISGDTGSVGSYGLHAGDGFRSDAIDFRGGQGGIKIVRADNVRVGPISATNQRNTDTGSAAGCHIGGGESIHVTLGEISDSDRGVEVDDVSDSQGTADTDTVTVEGGVVRNIDHTQATNPYGYGLVLDAHNHDTGGVISNVVFRNIRVETCQSAHAIKAGDHGQGCEVVFEGITLVDSMGPKLKADATLRDITFSNPNFGDDRCVTIEGGNTIIENISPDSNLGNVIHFTTAPGAGHGSHTIRDIEIPDGFTRFVRDDYGVGMDHLRVENVYCVADIEFEGMVFSAGSFAGSNRWAMELHDIELNMKDGSDDVGIQMDTADPPIRIIGGFINGSITVPSGSVQTNVRT